MQSIAVRQFVGTDEYYPTQCVRTITHSLSSFHYAYLVSHHRVYFRSVVSPPLLSLLAYLVVEYQNTIAVQTVNHRFGNSTPRLYHRNTCYLGKYFRQFLS